MRHIVMAAVLFGASPAVGQSLYAGAAQSVYFVPNPISPPWIYGAGDVLNHIFGSKDEAAPIRATAFFLSNGSTSLCFVAVDVLAISRRDADEVRDALSSKFSSLSLVPQNILINASHSHNAPAIVNAHAARRTCLPELTVPADWVTQSCSNPDDNFLVMAAERDSTALKAAITTAATTAINNRRLANLRILHSTETQEGQNSRILMADGMVRWVDNYGTPWIAATGQVDADFPVIALEDASQPGNLIGAMFGLAVHPGGPDHTVLSAGAYGKAAHQLSDANPLIPAAPPFPVAHLSGAAGSTHDVMNDTQSVRTDRVVQRVTDALGRMPPPVEPVLAAAQQSFAFNVRSFDQSSEKGELTSYFQAHLCNPSRDPGGWQPGGNCYEQSHVFDTERGIMAGWMGQPRTTWIQAIRIGDLAVVALPGEVFGSLATKIKERSPFLYTYVLGLSNDYVGYIPDSRAYDADRGGYQTWTGLHSYVPRGTGEAMVDAAVALLQTLGGQVQDARGRSEYVVVWEGRLQERRLATYVPDQTGRFKDYIDTVSELAFLSDLRGRDRGNFADVTGDGRADYVVVSGGTDGHRHFSVYVAKGNARFADHVDSVDNGGTFMGDTATGRDIGLFADVNGDGRADYVVIWNDGSGRRVFSSYLGRADGTFAVPPVQTLNLPGLFLPDTTGRDMGAFVDVNGDGRADYVVVWKDGSGLRHLATYRGQADGSFLPFVDTTDLAGAYWPDPTGRDRGLFADVNGDGRADYVVIWNDGSGRRVFSSYLGRADGTFAQPVQSLNLPGSFLADTTGRDMGTFVDVNGDRRADYVVIWKDGSGHRHLATYRGQTDGTFLPFVDTTDTWGLYVADTTGRDIGSFADVNGDGLADYIVPWQGADGKRHLAVYLGQTDGSFEQAIDTRSDDGMFIPDSQGRDSGVLADVH